MPTFYADHNVAFQLVQLMHARGYDVTFAREQGLESASDAAHLLHAATRGRILLTHNERDFLLLHQAWTLWTASWNISPRHAGVIVLPQQELWSPRHALHEIETVLTAAPILSNEFWRWKASRGWHSHE